MIKPLAGYTLIEQLKAEETIGSIIVAEDAQRIPVPKGLVVEASLEKYIGDQSHPMQVKKGDTVYFIKRGPNKITVDKKELFLVYEGDILAIES